MNPLSVRLELYPDELAAVPDERYERLELSVLLPAPPGVLDTFELAVLLALRGAGALIKLFFGVSVAAELLRELPTRDEELVFLLLGVDKPRDGVCGMEDGVCFPASMNGCLSAACGLMRRSGSQTRHLAMKSTKSSSSVRRT